MSAAKEPGKLASEPFILVAPIPADHTGQVSARNSGETAM